MFIGVRSTGYEGVFPSEKTKNRPFNNVGTSGRALVKLRIKFVKSGFESVKTGSNWNDSEIISTQVSIRLQFENRSGENPMGKGIHFIHG